MGYMDGAGRLEGSLEAGVDLGFSERTANAHVYQFAHDRVRQASLVLAKEQGTQTDVGMLVGQYLLSRPDPELWMFFAGVDHLNSVPLDELLKNGMSLVGLAELNWKAGKKAADLTSFAPAALYYKRAVDLLNKLGHDRWVQQYQLNLEVYSSAADVEFRLGRFSVGSAYVNEVIVHAQAPMDTVRVRSSLAEAMGQQLRNDEAVGICKEVLSILGEKTRRRNLMQVMMKIRKIKPMYMCRTADELANLPLLSDPRRVASVETLSMAAHRAVWAGDMAFYVWAIVRCAEIAVTEGICAASINGVSMFSSILAALEFPLMDVDLGLKIALGVRKMVQRFDATSWECRVLFNACK